MDILTIDGSHGEGGGQVLRTSLSLSALTGRPFRMVNIRASRSKPGLRPQHLTAVHAVAAICDAELVGAEIDSETLEFHPAGPPHSDDFEFDVTDVARYGSAGAATLVLQAALWPLVFADTHSEVVIRGGTHVPFSPPYHYLAEVAQPVFSRFNAFMELKLDRWGWMQAGEGQITAKIRPVPHLEPVILKRVPITRVQGVAAVTNLPAHIPQRMVGRTYNLLRDAGLKSSVQPVRESGAGPGAGIFLWVPQAGFGCLGRQGMPSEQVAEEAVDDLLEFVQAEGAAVDPHLADQLLIPMALAAGRSSLTTNHLTEHTLTNAQVLRRWLDVPILIEGQKNGPARVTVEGIGFTVTS